MIELPTSLMEPIPNGNHRSRSSSPLEVRDDCVILNDVVVRDRSVAEYLRDIDEDRRLAEFERILAVGVRGLATMSTGVRFDAITTEVERLVGDAVQAAEAGVARAIEAGHDQMRSVLDPDHRSSLASRVVTEIDGVHQQILGALDPNRGDSPAAQLLGSITGLVGPDGHLERRLQTALDPADESSIYARLSQVLDTRLAEMRDLIVGRAGREEEARRGTAKGLRFEDVVEGVVRSQAASIGGCVVERTSTQPGTLGSNAVVGDLVVTIPNGRRVVIEAKHVAGIGLSGTGGILAELDRAMLNRDADLAICVSHDDAFPAEVGPFGIYGNRLLCVDDGDGTLLGVALRWAVATLSQGQVGIDGIDTELIQDRLTRLRELGARFSRSKRALGAVQSGVDNVRAELDGLRSDLIDLVDEIAREVARHARSAATCGPG